MAIKTVTPQGVTTFHAILPPKEQCDPGKSPGNNTQRQTQRNARSDCLECFLNLLAHKRELKNYHDIVSIRGVGLMIGIQLRVDCSQITKIALDNGLLVNVTNSNVIRLLPPLIISHKEVEILLARLVFSIKTFFEK